MKPMHRYGDQWLINPVFWADLIEYMKQVRQRTKRRPELRLTRKGDDAV